MVIMIVLLCSALAIAGCTGTQTSPAATTPGSGTPAGTGTTPASSMVSLTTVPTDIVPGTNQVTVDVGVKDYLGNIEVIYQGGMGQIHVKKISTTITRADGKAETIPVTCRIDTPIEIDYYQHGGILPYVLRQLVAGA